MRLIDADAIKEKIDDIWDGRPLSFLGARILVTIDEAPTIDADRPQGEWKPFDLTWGRSIWYCTACEESTEVPCDIWEHKPIYKYCPNCGARMKGADFCNYRERKESE